MKNAFSCFFWQLNHLKSVIKEISRANFVEYKTHFETYSLKHTVILRKYCHSTHNNVMNGMQFCQKSLKVFKIHLFYFTTTRVWNSKFQIYEDKYRSGSTEANFYSHW